MLSISVDIVEVEELYERSTCYWQGVWNEVLEKRFNLKDPEIKTSTMIMSIREVIDSIRQCIPDVPKISQRSKNSISFDWTEGVPKLEMYKDRFLYQLQMRTDSNQWICVYYGKMTQTVVNNLTPSMPHKFRLKYILRNIGTCADDFNVNKDVTCLKVETNIKSNKMENNDFYSKDGETLTEEHVNISNNQDNSYITDAKNLLNAKELNEINDEIKFKESEDVFTQNINNDKMKNDKFHKCIYVSNDSGNRIHSKWSEILIAYTTRDDPSVIHFYMAVYGGHTKQILEIFEKRPSLLNTWNNIDGLTPLCVAIKKGDLQTCQYLLKIGADIEAVSANSQTPLLTAIYHKRLSIASFLLDKGANLYIKGNNKMTALHYAVDTNDLAQVELMLERGCSPDDKDSKGWTPLFRAGNAFNAIVRDENKTVTQRGDINIMAALIEHGCNLDEIDANKISCAKYSAVLKLDESIQKLVNKDYTHTKAISNYTKLTRKLSNVQNLINTQKAEN